MLARSRKEAGTTPRKRTGYDAACYYDGKLLGRCTKADSDAYTLLMNACGGEAARVLREYAYFSPELRAILEPSVRGCFWYLPPATAERWWQTR